MGEVLTAAAKLMGLTRERAEHLAVEQQLAWALGLIMGRISEAQAHARGGRPRRTTDESIELLRHAVEAERRGIGLELLCLEKVSTAKKADALRQRVKRARAEFDRLAKI